MEKAPLGIEKAREERINSNTERMKQLGIHTIARDVNGLSNMKKIDPTRKSRVEMSSEEQGVVGEGSSPQNHCGFVKSVVGEGSSHSTEEMDIEEYNPSTSSDSSSGEEEPLQIKDERIFESYVEAGGVHKEGSKEWKWKYIKSPKQEGGKVCGFYVMKHMQDLVTTQFDVFPDCDLPTKKYTSTQLHAITRQWCRFFLDNY